jgi:hypothetical protein
MTAKKVMQVGPGLKGFVCPPQVPTAGERHDVDFCLSDCQHPCVAEPLIAAIYEANVRNPHKGAYLSASMIAGSGCERQTYFQRLDPDGYYELVRNVYWPFRGTIAHKVIEERGEESFKLTQFMQEITMRVPMVYPDRPAPVFNDDGIWTGEYDESKPLVIVLGGTCDAYSPWKRKLYDFKTMACAKARMVVEDGKQDAAWEVQMNIYRWLIAHTEITEEYRTLFRSHGLDDFQGQTHFPAPETLRIQGMSMMELPFTGQGYVMQRTSEIKDIPAINVYPIDTIEQMIRERSIKWFEALVLGIKPAVVGKDRAWMCKNCVFNGEVIPGERCFPKQERDASSEVQGQQMTVEEEPKKPRKPRAPRKKKPTEDIFG